MVRFFYLILLVLMILPQTSWAEKDGGDIGGSGNEQGNGERGDLCKQYNLCWQSVNNTSNPLDATPSMDMVIYRLQTLQSYNPALYQSLKHYVLYFKHKGSDQQLAAILREAIGLIELSSLR